MVSMIEKVDMRDLVPLQKLERVSINVPFENIEALLDLPSLRQAGRFSGTPAARGVLETLKQRGVQVN